MSESKTCLSIQTYTLVDGDAYYMLVGFPIHTHTHTHARLFAGDVTFKCMQGYAPLFLKGKCTIRII